MQSAQAYNYNKLEIYYLSIGLINTDSVKKFCLILSATTLILCPILRYFVQLTI